MVEEKSKRVDLVGRIGGGDRRFVGIPKEGKLRKATKRGKEDGGVCSGTQYAMQKRMIPAHQNFKRRWDDRKTHETEKRERKKN